VSILDNTLPYCRSCNQQHLQLILSLGQMPLANALLTADQLAWSEETFPLDLVFCPDCTLVQITETVPPEKLFREYFYLSSFSDTVLENAHQIASRLAATRRLNAQSMVVEIASNDGYLLNNYREAGILVLGIEPALNIARKAEAQGIRTVSEFFNVALAQRLRDEGMTADVIHANNVVAHVADLKGVVEGIGVLLKPDGVAVIENHYVKDLIDHVEFDSIYHEHLCYYSVTAFNNLFRQFNMVMVDAERIPMHGGSLRVFFQREEGPQTWEAVGRERVLRLLTEEQDWGVGQFAFYRDFGNKVAHLRRELLALLRRLKSEGRRIAVYGASAKSTTLLNYFGIGSEILDFVADRSTVKQNHYTPGTHLPIVAPEKLLEIQPDYVLLLAWNFADEVLFQQAEYRKRGGRFIVPIPELRVI